MSRYIDADKIIYSWQIDLDGQEHDGVTLQSIINKMPSIDAVPVVRCKECKYLLPNDRIAPNWWRICDYWRTGVDENEYCSHGEREKE